jgi:hypothetical protein
MNDVSVRHMATNLDADSVVEVVCTQPGPCDGMRMGYAIKFSGIWEAWTMSLKPQTARMVVVGSREDAIAAVVEMWNQV